MTALMENIRKAMGWCPKKDFGLVQAGSIKHTADMLDFGASYPGCKKKRLEKVLVDVPLLDSGMIRILLPVGVIGFMLMIGVNQYSILDFFIVFAYYLVFLLLVLQNRTTVEFTQDTIIIHRPFLRSVVIQQNEVKARVTNNFTHTVRWIIRPIALIVLIFLANHNINAIHIISEQSLPVLVRAVNIFSIPIITVMFGYLFYNFEIRTRYMAVVSATANKRQFTFFVDNPGEFSAMLQQTGDINRSDGMRY